MANPAETRNGYAPVEGGQLYYEVSGFGRPLVLIHAGVADHCMWDEQVQAFSPFYRVIRYDLRGFGKTIAKTEAGGSFPFRHDLLDLLQHLGVAKISVLGLSLGGQIALDFTLEHPERIEALVAVASGLSGFEHQPPAQEVAAFDEMRTLGKSQNFAKLAQVWAKIWVDGPRRATDPVRDGIRAQIILPTFFPPQAPPAVGRLGEIKVPTLVIWGDQDTTTVQAGCEKLVKGIQGAQQVIFADTAHMVNLERPEQFNQVVLDFLNQQFQL